MSQQYPPGDGPPPEPQPDYGQTTQYGGQPQQPYGQPQQPYVQPPQYQQQQPPPYGQPQGYSPYPQQHAYAPAPPQVVEADAFERTLSLLGYVWVVMFTVLVGGSVLEFRNDYKLQFFLHLTPLAGLILPLVVVSVVKTGQLARFHATQALYVGALYLVARFVVGFLLLIPERGDPRGTSVRSVLIEGILMGVLQLAFVWLALTGGVRAFFNRELYRLPIIGGMVR